MTITVADGTNLQSEIQTRIEEAIQLVEHLPIDYHSEMMRVSLETALINAAAHFKVKEVKT